MKKVCFLFIFFFPLFIFPNQIHEPKLLSWSMENDEVVFALDNGWFFVGEVRNYNMLYILNHLIQTRVRVETFAQTPFLTITFENPENLGHDKISYLGYVREETYRQLLRVSDIEFNNSIFYFFCPTGYVTLSDGSRFVVDKSDLFVHYLETFWSKGDHILVTKKYSSAGNWYSLVNLDVSGSHYVDYLKSQNEHWYSMRDPRTVEATMVSD